MNFDYQKKLIEPIRKAVQQDPKKAGILGVLSLVLLILIGRMGLKGKTEPTSAEANLLLPSSEVPLNPISTGRKADKKSVDQLSLREWLGSPVKPAIQRNIFAINVNAFKRPGGVIGGDNTQAKSLPFQTDQMNGVVAQGLDQQIGDLRLESTLVGAKSHAMISGQVVTEGQTFTLGERDDSPSFRVKKIETRRVILESGGMSFEVNMK